MEYLSEKYKDQIKKINSGIKVLNKRKKKLKRIKFWLPSSAWERRDLAEILLEKIDTKKFRLTCKSHELESKPYYEWAHEFSDEQVVMEYLNISEKVKRLNIKYDRLQELRDEHSRFSKNYKNLDELAKRSCSELSEHIHRRNALDSEILTRCGIGIGPIEMDYYGPFKRLLETKVA